MTFNKLLMFIEKSMRMSHIYQPVMIRTLLDAGGTAAEDEIARYLLSNSQYQHNNGEDNADAHLKRSIMGREVVVAITNGKMDFGPWEQIFYGEFDGRRRKRVLVKIIGE